MASSNFENVRASYKNVITSLISVEARPASAKLTSDAQHRARASLGDMLFQTTVPASFAWRCRFEPLKGLNP